MRRIRPKDVPVPTMTLIANYLLIALVGQRGGFGPEGFQLNPGDSLELVRRPDVQTHIGLTSDQALRIRRLEKTLRNKWQDEMMHREDDFDEKLAPSYEAIAEEFRNEVRHSLSEGQRARLRELWIQRYTYSTILDPQVQKDIGLTGEQKTKISYIQIVERERLGRLAKKAQNMTRAERAALFYNEGSQKTLQELKGLLRDDQRSKLKALSGAPFNSAGFGFN